MKEKKMSAITFTVVLCFLLTAPLFATNGSSVLSADDFTISSDGDYPTPNGEPYFTLHIAVSQESPLAFEIVNVISESLHDIGIEGVVHPVPFMSLMRGLFPEDYGVSQYGFERPCPSGPPEIVTVFEPRDIHFQHEIYSERGVMWCGEDDSDLATPPGYGDNWDDHLTKSFQLPAGTVSMSYAVQWDCEWGWDFFSAEISRDGGNTFETMLQLSGVSDWFEDPYQLAWYVGELQRGFPTLIDIQTPDELGFAVIQTDLSDYGGENVQIRFGFVSDVTISDQDGWWDSNGACRIDWIGVTGNPIDDFTTDDDGWEASAPPLSIDVMQGYDITFLGWNLNEAYRSFDGFFHWAHSESADNQGYFNPVFDALWNELDAIPIDWNENFPDPPDLDNPNGQRALEILNDLQAIWSEDIPILIHFNRMLWESGGGTGFTGSPWNLANEHLANPEVRRAINLALRRQEILDLYGYEPPWEATAVQTWLAPWHPGYDPAFQVVYDPAEAWQIIYDIFVVEPVRDIADNVEDLIDIGVLSAGEGNSLTKKLESVIAALDRHNYIAAYNKLSAFTNEVNALIASGRLTESEGGTLLEAAEEIASFLDTI
ncbi:MAG: hypothetical protein RTU92_06140 [Candidatus Thorarchaeota archaeon]